MRVRVAQLSLRLKCGGYCTLSLTIHQGGLMNIEALFGLARQSKDQRNRRGLPLKAGLLILVECPTAKDPRKITAIPPQRRHRYSYRGRAYGRKIGTAGKTAWKISWYAPLIGTQERVVREEDG